MGFFYARNKREQSKGIHMKLIAKIKCILGKHVWQTPIVNSLETYWLQAGKECSHCRKFVIEKVDVTNATNIAYLRGQENQCLSPKTLYQIKGLAYQSNNKNKSLGLVTSGY